MDMNYEFIINHEGTLVIPAVKSGISWNTERKGQAGRLRFSILKYSKCQLSEGDAVRFKANGKNVFYGFIFKLNYKSDKIVDVVAYDQLYYLRNKDTFQYAGKTANQVISMLANDFNLKCGTLENTGYTIESRIEDNQTLFDMIQNALDITLTNTGNLYVLYDDFGKLTLKNLSNMKVNLMIDNETAQDFAYESSIDGQTYNKIKLTYDNQQSGKREIYIAQDGSNINKWGVLQYFESLSDNLGAKAKADSLLKLYNNKNTSLTIRGAFGDTSVRAGSLVMVQLDLGDTVVKSYLMVESCAHRFGESEHFMDLVLTGGALK